MKIDLNYKKNLKKTKTVGDKIFQKTHMGDKNRDWIRMGIFG